MIPVTTSIALDEAEIEETFIRASGPGGQNVNKVATAVQLRFDAAASPNLPEAVKTRLKAIAGQRMTKDGVIVLTAEKFRERERNRLDALDRLIALIHRAAIPPKKRRPTKPTKAAKTRRLDAKKRKGAVKAKRGRVKME